jgi:hypothetical protein
MKKTWRPMKQWLEGMSNAAWAADIQWRAVVNQDRRKRKAATKMKKAAAVAALYPPLSRRLRESRKRVVSDELVAFFPGDFPRGVIRLKRIYNF